MNELMDGGNSGDKGIPGTDSYSTCAVPDVVTTHNWNTLAGIAWTCRYVGCPVQMQIVRGNAFLQEPYCTVTGWKHLYKVMKQFLCVQNSVHGDGTGIWGYVFYAS